MKIGIMTSWTSIDNYGQQLQCYAMQTYLRQLGHSPYLIRYDTSKDSERTFSEKVADKAKHSYKAFKPKYWTDKIRNKKMSPEHTLRGLRERKFSEFQAGFMTVSDEIYRSYNELKDNPPEADVYLSGSDQVWHTPDDRIKSTSVIINAYMLDFGDPKTKRVAAAASWGSTTLSDEWKAYIVPLIRKFDAITVREASGVNLCKELGVDARVALDPTLYLTADEYRKVYELSEIRKPSKPYVMVYWVNNGNATPMKAIQEWCNRKGLSLEYVTANTVIDGYDQNYATVPEWIYLIDHADYVITNSFHACVFSLLFEKKFGVYKISGQHKGMNSRLDSLFENCHVTPRYIIDDDFRVLNMGTETIKLRDELKLKEALAKKIII